MHKIFEKLQNYFGVDLGYIIRGGFWLGLDQAMAMIVGIILSVAFANLLLPESYGVYRYILSIFSILTITTLPNMNVAVTTSVARGFEGMMAAALKTRIRWGFLGSVAAIIISGYYFSQNNFLLGWAFFVMVIAVPFVDSLNLYSAYLKGKKLFKLQAQYSVIVRLISAAVLIMALFLTKNILLILLAYFIPYIVLRPIFAWLTFRKFPPNEQKDPAMISYGKHLSIIQLLGVAVNYLDNLLIFHYLGAVPLAVYSIAMAPISKIQQAFSILGELALPKFSTRSVDDIKKMLMSRIGKAFLFVLAGVIIYILAAPSIFRLLFPKYLESVFYTQLLAIILLTLPFGLIYTFLQSHALKVQLYKYNVGIRIAQLILVATLVYFYGILGAVIARILFQAVSLIILLALFKKID